MFINCNKKILNTNTIRKIDYSRYIETGNITLFLEKEIIEVGIPESTDIIMRLCPNALEGHRAKYYKRAWMLHNLIGHPLMQLFSLLGISKLGIMIHDKTIPRPKKK